MDKPKSKLPLVCPENVRKVEKEKDLTVDSKKKENNPITSSQFSRKLGKPHKLRMPAQIPLEGVKSAYQDSIGHRIISAKMLRVKELQNQLSDTQYRLNELANENRILRILQKRQDSALKKYEGANAELPRIINSHYEELKALQVKYKQLKKQHRQTCEILKERENEIQILQDQNKHFLRLSKDQNLMEREKLQIQVADLNYQIQQQHETIQVLNRKLSLESKKLMHQIQFEMGKHRETKKQLDESLDKIRRLEELLDGRERRLYENARFFKLKTSKTSSQSLISLKNPSSTKVPRQNVDENDFKSNILPKLTIDCPETPKVTSRIPKSETMTSFHQIRKFRLQKSTRTAETADLQPKKQDSYQQNEEICAQIDLDKLEDHHLTDFDGLDDNNVDNFEDKVNPDQQLSHYNIENLVGDQYRALFASSESESDGKSDIVASQVLKSKNLHARLTLEDSPQSQPKDDEEIEENIGGSLENLTGIEEEQNYRSGNSKSDLRRFDEVNNVNNSDNLVICQKKSWIDLKKAREDDENELKSVNLLEKMSSNVDNDDDLLNYFNKDNLITEDKNKDIESNLEVKMGEITEVNNKNVKTIADNNNLKKLNNNERNNIKKFLLNGDINNFDKGKNISDDESSNKNEVIKSPKLNSNSKNINDVNNVDNHIDNNNSSKNFHFNKDELLAAIKAIDNNDNELINNDNKKNRQQITENLYRGIPTQAKKRDDIIRDIFNDTKIDRLRPGCSKLH